MNLTLLKNCGQLFCRRSFTLGLSDDWRLLKMSWNKSNFWWAWWSGDPWRNRSEEFSRKETVCKHVNPEALGCGPGSLHVQVMNSHSWLLRVVIIPCQLPCCFGSCLFPISKMVFLFWVQPQPPYAWSSASWVSDLMCPMASFYRTIRPSLVWRHRVLYLF